MPLDYKKAYKDLYQPACSPSLIEVPPMRFVAVDGTGDPNEEGGAYGRALELLYGVSYTLKMSPKAGYDIAGYEPYVVPPLEGFWWQDGVEGVDYAAKAAFNWTSAIRLPDFVTRADFDWAIEEATRKKKRDFSAVRMVEFEEGLCVQCLHKGLYDDEPATVAAMDAYAIEQGRELDFSAERRHHEIYLGDPRRTIPEKLRTVIRHPVR